MDITDAILDDHQAQRRLFLILADIPDSEIEALGAVWGRLRDFLEAHARAEELHFYPCLLRRGEGAADAPSAVAETCDAIKDHNEIRQAIARAEGCAIGGKAWRDAVAAVEKANGDHMAEEERQGLADFRRTADGETRQRLGIAYLAFEFRHLEGAPGAGPDPESYVRENGPQRGE